MSKFTVSALKLFARAGGRVGGGIGYPPPKIYVSKVPNFLKYALTTKAHKFL